MVSKTDVFTRKTSIPTSESRFGVEDRNEVAIRETLQRRGEKAQYQHYERQAIPMKESIIKQLKDEIEYYKDRIESAKEDEQRYKQYAREARNESSADRYDERRREARNEQSAYKRAISAIEKELNKYEKIEDPLMIVGYGDKFGNEVIRYGNDIVRNEKANFKAELRYEKELKAAKDKVIADGGKVEGGLGYDSSGNVIQIFDSQGQKTYQNMLKNQSLVSGQPIYLNDASGKLTAVVYDGKYVATTNREWAEQQVAKSQPVVTSASVYGPAQNTNKGIEPIYNNQGQLVGIQDNVLQMSRKPTLLEQQTYSKLGIGTTNLIQPAIQKVTPQIQSTVTVAPSFKEGLQATPGLANKVKFVINYLDDKYMMGGLPGGITPKEWDKKKEALSKAKTENELNRLTYEIVNLVEAGPKFEMTPTYISGGQTSMPGDKVGPGGVIIRDTLKDTNLYKLASLEGEFKKQMGYTIYPYQSFFNIFKPSSYTEIGVKKAEGRIDKLQTSEKYKANPSEFQKEIDNIVKKEYWNIPKDILLRFLVRQDLDANYVKQIVNNTGKDIQNKNLQIEASLKALKGFNNFNNANVAMNNIDKLYEGRDIKEETKKVEKLVEASKERELTRDESEFIRNYNILVENINKNIDIANNEIKNGAIKAGINYKIDDDGNVKLDDKYLEDLNRDLRPTLIKLKDKGITPSVVNNLLFANQISDVTAEVAYFLLSNAILTPILSAGSSAKIIQVGGAVQKIGTGARFMGNVGTFGRIALPTLLTTMRAKADFTKGLKETGDIRYALGYGLSTAILYGGAFVAADKFTTSFEKRQYEEAVKKFNKFQQELRFNPNYQRAYLTEKNLQQGYVPFKTGKFEFRIALNKNIAEQLRLSGNVFTQSTYASSKFREIELSAENRIRNSLNEFLGDERIAKGVKVGVVETNIGQELFNVRGKQWYVAGMRDGNKQIEWFFRLSKNGKIISPHVSVGYFDPTTGLGYFETGKISFSYNEALKRQMLGIKGGPLDNFKVKSIGKYLVQGSSGTPTSLTMLDGTILNIEKASMEVKRLFGASSFFKSGGSYIDFLNVDPGFFIRPSTLNSPKSTSQFGKSISTTKTIGDDISSISQRNVFGFLGPSEQTTTGLKVTKVNDKDTLTALDKLKNSLSKFRIDTGTKTSLTDLINKLKGNQNILTKAKPLDTGIMASASIPQAKLTAPKVDITKLNNLAPSAYAGLGLYERTMENSIRSINNIANQANSIERIIGSNLYSDFEKQNAIKQAEVLDNQLKTIDTNSLIKSQPTMFKNLEIKNEVEVLVPQIQQLNNISNQIVNLQNRHLILQQQNQIQQANVTQMQIQQQIIILNQQMKIIQEKIVSQNKALKQEQQQKLKQLQLQKQAIQKQLLRLMKGLPLTPLLPFGVPLSSPTTKKKVRKTIQTTKPISYIKEVRTKGKWVPVKGRYASYGEAMASGVHKTSTTLRASFRIKKVEKVPNSRISSLVVMDMMNMLRSRFYESPKEKGVWIEKPTYRLSTKTEVKEIREAKRRAERDKSFWFG